MAWKAPWHLGIATRYFVELKLLALPTYPVIAEDAMDRNWSGGDLQRQQQTLRSSFVRGQEEDYVCLLVT